jgi:predicted  nucleic acid-binding Zn-ribbon protein
LGGFLATSAGTFVSCKDYDDDITDLQSQIDALSKSSTDALSSKASELASQISSLTAAQTTLQQSLDAAKSDADTKVAAAKAAASTAQSSADAAQAAADAAQAVADAAKAQVEKLQAAGATKEELDAAKQVAADAAAAAAKAAEAAQGTGDAALAAAAAAQTTADAATAAVAELQANGATKAELDAAKSAADAANSAVSQAVAKAQNTADQALTAAQEALGRVATLEAQVATINQTLESLQAEDAILAAQIEEVKKQIAAGDSKADANLALVNDNIDKVKAELEAQLEALDGTISTLKTDLKAELADVNAQLADKASNADLQALAARADKLEDQIAGLDALDKKIDKAVDDLTAAYKAADEVILAQLASDKADLNDQITATNSDLAAYKEEVNAQLVELFKLQDALAQQKLALENYQKEVEENLLPGLKSDLQAEIKSSIATAVEGVNTQISALEAKVDAQQAQWEAYVEKTLKEYGLEVSTISTITSDISGLKGDVTGINTAIEGLSGDIADLQAAITTLTDKDVADIVNAIDAINEDLAAYVKSEDFNAYKADIEEQLATITNNIQKNTDDIAAIKEQLENVEGGLSSNLNVLSALFSTRLTSLVFAPSTYINGIESIEFSSLKYTAWKSNAISNYLDRAAALTANDVTIGKDEAQATYYYSPSNATIDKDKLSLNFRSATNLVTRATAEPVAISKIIEAQNGKLVLALKKNSTDNLQGTLASATNQKESFTILSLTSQIELTDEEAAAGVSPYVSSDWARLYETAITPYIHQKSIKDCGNQDESDEDGNAPEFYSFETIHSNGGARVEKDAICDTDGKYIVKEQVYNEPLDLSTLVTVCDLDNQKLDNYADYGLAFTFNLVPYKLLSVNTANEEETDQADFATISGSTITSHAQKLPDLINNRDAIGREPLIQAVLKDTENGNIVDIRYFKIKWVATTPTTMSVEFDTLKEKDPYTCGDAYEEYILTDEMNQKIYARVNNEQGIAKTDFHNQYTLDTNLYLNKEDATKGENATTDYGTIEEIVADGSTVTYNLKWTITPSDKVFDGIEGYTKAEYEAGTATRTVYGRYTLNGSSEGMIIFKLSLSFDIAKMSTIGYRGTQWDVLNPTASNASKSLNVNPALTSDANYGTAASFTDCQLITDLLFGYYYANSEGKNVSPSEITEVVKNLGEGDNVDVQFIFDSSRLNILPGSVWSVSADGKTLIKTTNGVEEKAAVITDKNEIQLYEEGTPGVSGEPTDAARSLLSKQVPVKLNATNCAGINADLDKFLVRFVEPLEIVINNGDLELYDWTTGGDPASIEGVYTVQERFWGSNEPRKVVYYDADKDELVKDDELVAWYIVEDLNWDFENAKTNLKFDGTNLVISNKIDQDWSAYSEDYNLTLGILDKETGDLTISDKTNDPDANVIVFQNQSGNSIQQEFKVSVPVTLPTKWNSPSMTKYVTVTIKSGHEKE